MGNLSEQLDEITALASIYGKDWKVENENKTVYSVQVTRDVKLFVTFVPGYPSDAPPNYEMTAPSLKAKQKKQIEMEFRKIYKKNCGSPVLFQWIEKLKELLWDWGHIKKGKLLPNNYVKREEGVIRSQQLQVTHGPSIQDRKSVFQGHACRVKSQDDIKNFKEHLLSNKKLAQAKHNILAYRIKLPSGLILQDYDEDGEAHAGGRLLHLLQLIDVLDVAVVVTRWYGGIHLGPDRFRHINNAAHQVLAKAEFIKS